MITKFSHDLQKKSDRKAIEINSYKEMLMIVTVKRNFLKLCPI
jgi:hypothetical protein